MATNPTLLADAYKIGHKPQYPDGTEFVYSNYTARSSRVPGQNHAVFFGLQYFLKKYLIEEFNEKFFCFPASHSVSKYQRRIAPFLGTKIVNTKHLYDLWDLSYIPLRVRALPEGTLTPMGVPMLTVENTVPEFFWMTNYIESIMSNIINMPITSATTAFRYRSLLEKRAQQSGGDLEFVKWQGHDFSFRGMSGLEAAQLSGAGHLLSFYGTDTLPALDLIEDYYNWKESDGILGGSVNATEHSVMCAGGFDDELGTFRRLLRIYPEGILSIVSDTWDLWIVCTKYLRELKEEILSRNGKLVIRPDSGDPVKILCGDPDALDGSAASKGVIQLLWEVFGGTTNAAGYKVLDPHIGAIYGDSITYERADEICQRLMANGFATSNVVLGIGSFTYQYVTRDTYGQAMKATWVQVNGEGRDIYKKPVTDNGLKTSAKGRLAVFRNPEGELYLVNQATPEQEDASLLTECFLNGKITRESNFADMRKLVESYL